MGDAHEEEKLHKQHGDYVEQEDEEEEQEIEEHHEEYQQEEEGEEGEEYEQEDQYEEEEEQEGQQYNDDEGSSGQASANLGSSPESSDNEEDAHTMSLSKNKQQQSKKHGNREVEMTSQMKDRSIVQRDSSVQKRNVASKNKKKNHGSDSDDSNDEGHDEVDEDDDDDDDIDEYSYDSEEEERRRKIREQYDIQDTCMKWIGFFVGTVIIALLIWLMNSTSSSYNRQTTKQDKQIPLEPQTNYPFDIMFQNLEYKGVKDQSDRTKAAQCGVYDVQDFYEFELPKRQEESNDSLVSSEELSKDALSTVSYISEVDIKCTSGCNSFPIHQNNTATTLSYEQIIKTYSCIGESKNQQVSDDDLPVFSNGSCKSCPANCHRCSMFSGYCNGCYSGFTLFNKTCVKKCPFTSIVEEFCVQDNPQYEQKLNMSFYSANDFQLYLIHKPPMIVIEPSSIPEKADKAIESIDGSGLTPEELNSNELVVEKQKSNSTITTTPSAFTMPKITQYKKYPLIILLNDWRYTQEDLFAVPSIARYLDKAFILSMPFFQPQLSSKDLHQLIIDEVKEMLKNEQQAIEFYAIVGLGATGQLAAEIALNQGDERRHWEARFLITIGISEKNFAVFITQENRLFEESIKSKDTYFQDRQFCRLESRQKQIASIVLEEPESINTPLKKLDFYVKKSFDEIFHHYEAKKLSINTF